MSHVSDLPYLRNFIARFGFAEHKCPSTTSSSGKEPRHEFSDTRAYRLHIQVATLPFSQITKSNQISSHFTLFPKPNPTMSGNSSVGQGSVYEAGDQRNYKDSEAPHPERFHEGQVNSHKANDSSMFSLW